MMIICCPVTGVKLEAERLRDFVFTVLKNKTLRDGSVNTMLTCEDVDEVVCYLVDDGGFLVISNQDNETFTVRFPTVQVWTLTGLQHTGFAPLWLENWTERLVLHSGTDNASDACTFGLTCDRSVSH